MFVISETNSAIISFKKGQLCGNYENMWELFVVYENMWELFVVYENMWELFLVYENMRELFVVYESGRIVCLRVARVYVCTPLV